jgi:hypothetical protein
MKTKNLSQRIFAVFLLFCVGTWLVWALVFWFTFDPASMEAWAQFGDSFNMLNTLFSSIALVGVLLAIILQQQELKLQRQELEQNRQEFKDSALENAFFKMLETHQVMTSNIVIYERKAPLHAVLPRVKKVIEHLKSKTAVQSPKQSREEYKGLKALEHIARNLRLLGCELPRITAKEERLKIWRRSLSNLRQSLGRSDCYIHSFINILDYVDSQEGYAEKERLINIATNQLTQIELRFICHFFGCYNLDESPRVSLQLSKFQRLNSKYKILQNLHPSEYLVRKPGDTGPQFMWSFEGRIFQSDEMFEAAKSISNFGINFAP